MQDATLDRSMAGMDVDVAGAHANDAVMLAVRGAGDTIRGPEFGSGRRQAKDCRDIVGITVNCNMAPFDLCPPIGPSGLRTCNPTLITRGFANDVFCEVSDSIAVARRDRMVDQPATDIRARMEQLAVADPLPRTLSEVSG